MRRLMMAFTFLLLAFATNHAQAGFALVDSRLPAGMLVSFSAEAGGLAMDGEGDHSPYVEALSRHLLRPGAQLTDILREVRNATVASTAGQQKPAYYDTTSAAFALLDKDGKVGDARPRYALVIGNGNYAHAASLKNVGGDAELISSLLKQAEFEVELVADADLKTMNQAIARLQEKASGEPDGAVVALFFAGNAISVGGTNYLIPVDARVASENDVAFELLSLEAVLGADFGRQSLLLAFIDGCRNNPFVSAGAAR